MRWVILGCAHRKTRNSSQSLQMCCTPSPALANPPCLGQPPSPLEIGLVPPRNMLALTRAEIHSEIHSEIHAAHKYACMNRCTYARTEARTHTDVRTQACTPARMHAHTHTHTHTHSCTHVRTHASIYKHKYTHTPHVHTHARTHHTSHAHTDAHIHSRWPGRCSFSTGQCNNNRRDEYTEEGFPMLCPVSGAVFLRFLIWMLTGFFVICGI